LRILTKEPERNSASVSPLFFRAINCGAITEHEAQQLSSCLFLPRAEQPAEDHELS
jgi:hypothetical protein